MEERGKENTPSSLQTRSKVTYVVDRDCILCGEAFQSKQSPPPPGGAKGGGGVGKIGSLPMKASLQVTADRRKDSWGLTVKGRLASVLDDKTSIKIRYHRNCYKSFHNIKRKLSGSYSPDSKLSQCSSATPPPSQRRRISPSPLTCMTPPPPPPQPQPSTSKSTPQPAATPQRPPGRPPLQATLASRLNTTRRGRPTDEGKMQAFEQLCADLEASSDCQFDLRQLSEKLAKLNPSAQYSEKSLRGKLLARYKESVTFSSLPNQKTVLTFRKRASEILSEAFTQQKSYEEKDQLRTAAKIISNSIANMQCISDHYPSVSDIQEGGKALIPDSLLFLLKEIVKQRKRGSPEVWERKCVALANCIVAAVRPRTFLPALHLALAVHIHRNYASKGLVMLLNSMGFCASYHEAVKFENAILHAAPPRLDPFSFLQYSFDNVDYNVRTLTGLGTWHCMGGIRCITPASGVGVDPLLQKSCIDMSAAGRAALGTIPLKSFKYIRSEGLKSILVPHFTDEDFTSTSPEIMKNRCIDYLWVLGTLFRPEPTPGWSGYMDLRTTALALPYETSAVLPLPFVKLDPNNPNAIYTSLDFAVTEAKRHGQQHCFVTFDQPLFWKAVDIVHQSESTSLLRYVLVRLGGFHVLLSYLGCIGYFMGGSGLDKMWELVYAKNTVPHMLAGHAYSRAVRAHFLSQVAVVNLLLETYKPYFDSRGVDRVSIARAFGTEMGPEPCADPVPGVQQFIAALDDLPSAHNVGRTGNLWLQYIKLVEYLRWFLRAERSGNWELHLRTVQVMLPAFPAAGHLNYAKSIPLYLHLMSSLKNTLSAAEYDAFVTRGNFAVRRSDKYWAGLSSDLTIEQVLMAALKDQSGVTRGRGMTDATIATFVKTMPLCARVSSALRRFAGLNFSDTPEKHSDLRASCQRRDQAHTKMFCEYITAHSPLTKRPDQIVSVSTGIVGDASINCERAMERGIEIIKKMCGKKFSELKLERKGRVIPLSAMTSSIKIGGDTVPINVNQLFHRIVVLKLTDDELEECFTFELAPFPTSIFDNVTMRKGNKAAFIKVLDRYSAPDGVVPERPAFVLDGGNLLHSTGWPKPATFREVADAYVGSVIALNRKYNAIAATVVFDGYPEGPSTKDVEHLRRAVRTSADVAVEESTSTNTTQALFLTNSVNKQRLISFLTARFQQSGIAVVQSAGDADRDIITTAISEAQEGRNVVVVGEDTDLLILMITLTPRDHKISLMSSLPGKPVTLRHSQPLQAALGELVDYLLFAHAMTGCDTTSYLFKRTKKNALSKLANSPLLRQTVSVFNDPLSSLDPVEEAGEKFLLEMYGYPNAPSLGKARYLMYRRVIARQPLHAKFDPATLPPTSGAAKQHSRRVFHQVQAWRGNDLDPTEWGWQTVHNRLVPVKTTDAPAPPRVLKLIFCNCGTPCATNSCECYRSGLKCSSMCGRCAGVSCQNAATGEESDTSDEEAVDDPEAGLQLLDDDF